MSVKTPKICRVSDSRLRVQLASDPEYACEICGTKAHTKSTLCDPVPLEPDLKERKNSRKQHE